MVADTSNVGSNGGSHVNGGTTVTFAIPSLSILANAIDQWTVFTNVSGGGYGGFFDNTNNNYLLLTYGSTLGSYDLATTFGPLSGNGFIGTTGTSTSLGTLTLNSFSGQTTFTATSGSGGGDAPEPATLALAGLAFLGTLAGRRYRQSARTRR